MFPTVPVLVQHHTVIGDSLELEGDWAIIVGYVIMRRGMGSTAFESSVCICKCICGST